jgi:hypothetical protein
MSDGLYLIYSKIKFCLKHLNYHLLGILCGPVVKSGRIPALHAVLTRQRKRRWSWVQIPPGPCDITTL